MKWPASHEESHEGSPGPAPSLGLSFPVYKWRVLALSTLTFKDSEFIYQVSLSLPFPLRAVTEP